ncbi:hypothetical protein PMM47T1_05599 [Pseudomonas sp. M47T1]|uniref:hypothetical protein n=1 Tax=Pseudomonas sp. M47T1 TaxID=1179778 RepID=UPI0002606ECA|nr:hypothetical protein [Pseudomonas sp. M47T1]EIK97962.1 hypothetical protein PMM47T1_05599 [Pseudomonas sp. M47T1]
MNDFSSSWWALVLYAGPVLLCFVSLGFSFYLSRRHLDEMVHALGRSSQFSLLAPALLKQGWSSRMMLLATVWGAISWPRPGIRAGVLDPADIQNFPPGLRRFFRIKDVLTCVIIVWAIAATLVAKLA